MSDFNTYQAEIAFRGERIRKSVTKRHHRLPFVRRASEATRTTR